MFNKKTKDFFSFLENKFVVCVILFIISSILLSWLSYGNINPTLQNEGKPILGGIVGVFIFIIFLYQYKFRSEENTESKTITNIFNRKIGVQYAILLLVIPISWLLNNWLQKFNYQFLKFWDSLWFTLSLLVFTVADKFIFKFKISKIHLLVFPVTLLCSLLFLFLGMMDYPLFFISIISLAIVFITVFILSSIKNQNHFLLVTVSILSFEIIKLLGLDNNFKLDLNFFNNMIFAILSFVIILSTYFLLKKRTLIEYLLLQKITLFLSMVISYVLLFSKNKDYNIFSNYIRIENPFFMVEILIFLICVIYIFRDEIKKHSPKFWKFIKNILGPFPFNVLLYFLPFLMGDIYIYDVVKGFTEFTFTVNVGIISLIFLITLVLLWIGKRIGIYLQFGVIIFTTIYSILFFPFWINLYLIMFPFAIYEMLAYNKYKEINYSRK